MSDATIKFHCQHCHYRARVSAKYLGKTIECPKCRCAQKVVDDTSKPTGSTTAVSNPQTVKKTFVFTCSECSFRARIPENYRGKRIKCPSCKARVAAEPAAETRSLKRSETQVALDSMASDEAGSGGFTMGSGNFPLNDTQEVEPRTPTPVVSGSSLEPVSVPELTPVAAPERAPPKSLTPAELPVRSLSQDKAAGGTTSDGTSASESSGGDKPAGRTPTSIPYGDLVKQSSSVTESRSMRITQPQHQSGVMAPDESELGSNESALHKTDDELEGDQLEDDQLEDRGDVVVQGAVAGFELGEEAPSPMPQNSSAIGPSTSRIEHTAATATDNEVGP